MNYDLRNPPHDFDGVDAINNAQDKAMTTLREKIQERKRIFEHERSNIVPFVRPPRVLQELPLITEEVNPWGEFSYDRFMEVQERLDIAYANYLYWQEKKDFGEGFDESLKELIQTVDLYVMESLRVRY